MFTQVSHYASKMVMDITSSVSPFVDGLSRQSSKEVVSDANRGNGYIEVNGICS